MACLMTFDDFTDTVRVAGHTAEYVNKILGNVNAGIPKGGIDA